MGSLKSIQNFPDTFVDRSEDLSLGESRMAPGRDQKLHILDLTRSKVQQRGVGAGPSLSKSCQIMQSGTTSQRVLWLESVVQVQFYFFTRVLESELLALKPVKLCKAKRD